MMSALSRRSLREKRHAARVLEAAAEEAIDEYVRCQGEWVRTDHQRWREENEDILCALFDDECDFDDEYLDDDDDGFYDDFGRHYLDDIWGDDDDAPYLVCKVGSYYKDEKLNRTYLCCHIHSSVVFVNVLTGQQEHPSCFRLKEVS
jgi:type II secretory pathway pseudopilin PulG